MEGDEEHQEYTGEEDEIEENSRNELDRGIPEQDEHTLG